MFAYNNNKLGMDILHTAKRLAKILFPLQFKE